MTNIEKRRLARISQILKHISKTTSVLKQANGAGRVFELYVMMRIALDLKGKGWLVTPLASDGRPISARGSLPFIQRGGAPSGISPALVRIPLLIDHPRQFLVTTISSRN